MTQQELDDLASAYDRFVCRGVDLRSDTGFPVTVGLRTAVLATGWAETRYAWRIHPSYFRTGFWSITTPLLRTLQSINSLPLDRVIDVLALRTTERNVLREACKWNDELAAAVAGLAIYPALPRTHPTTAWEDLNTARKLAWGREVTPVTEDLWDECARIAAA
jgi:hypothetical protein